MRRRCRCDRRNWFRLHARVRPLHRPAEIGFSDPAGLSSATREAWQAIQSVTPSVPPGILGETRRPPPPSGCQLCRNPLVWAGVGAAVIGTVIVIAVTSSSKPPPIVTIDGHDFGR